MVPFPVPVPTSDKLRFRFRFRLHRYLDQKKLTFQKSRILKNPCPGLRIRIHFIWIRIRIQHFRLDTNFDPDPIRIQGFSDQKLKNNYSWKFFFIFFLIKNCNLPIPRPPYSTSKLQLSKGAIQHFKTWTFKKISTFVGHFCPPDPDSESGSGSTDPIESGSNPDSDPQPNLFTRFRFRFRWSKSYVSYGFGSITLIGTLPPVFVRTYNIVCVLKELLP